MTEFGHSERQFDEFFELGFALRTANTSLTREATNRGEVKIANVHS